MTLTGMIRRKRAATMLALGVSTILSLCSVGASAADPIAGRPLYLTTNGAPLACGNSGCHGTNVATNKNGILYGANSPSTIQLAISLNAGGMGFLSSYVNATDIANIAAYIANPNAVVTAPIIGVSTSTVAFASQGLTTTSAASTVTISNTGSANLSITSLTLGGANSGDFIRGGTCAAGSSVAPSGSCTVLLSFAPAAIGARSASLVVAHNAAGGPNTISISGTGTIAPVPVVSLTANSLTFAPQTVNTMSSAQTVTLTNTGGVALNFASLALTGAAAADFARSGTCAVGTAVPTNGSCTFTFTFRPLAAAASRVAQLAIASNATGAPHAIALAGSSTIVSVPDARLSATMLTFGNETVGVATPPQLVTITNAGSAVLSLASVAVSGADFAGNSACGGSLAPGANCVVSIAFNPVGTGARSGALNVASNSPGSPHAVQLSGVGFPVGTMPTVALDHVALNFAAQSLNTAGAAQTAHLTNNGPVPLQITNFSISGANAIDFARSGTCATAIQIAVGAVCTIDVTFTPIAAGTRIATLSIASNASGAPSIALSGQGTRPASSGGSTVAPVTSGSGATAPSASTNAGAGGCVMGSNANPDPTLLLLALLALFGTWRRNARRVPN